MRFTDSDLKKIKKLVDAINKRDINSSKDAQPKDAIKAKDKNDDNPRKIWRRMEELNVFLSQSKQRNDTQSVRELFEEYKMLYRQLEAIKAELDDNISIAQRIVKDYSKY